MGELTAWAIERIFQNGRNERSGRALVMRIGCLIFGLIVIFSGCSGIQLAQTGPEDVQFYRADCAKSGNIEGTQAYADCILQTWKMAEEKERARHQREEMLLMIRGSGMNNARSAYKNPSYPWR